LSRRKKLRRFIFTNPYVPIVSLISLRSPYFFSHNPLQLFRVINIAFTTSALGIAIQIRNIEGANHAMGAVGSSPYGFRFGPLLLPRPNLSTTRTVVVIFAPLTLLHVMAAIYVRHQFHLYSFGVHLGSTARVFWSSSRPLADLWQTGSHIIRSTLHLRLVGGIISVFRQLLYLSHTMRITVAHIVVQRDTSTS
jgi:hypothetical protein